MSILAENPNHVDVGTRVRHRPTGDVGTVAHLPRWGTASVVVRFDEPDEHGERIGAVLWPDLERVNEPPAPTALAASRAPFAAPAWAEQVDVTDDAEPFAVVAASLAMGRAVSQLATSATDRWFLELEQVVDLERADGTLYAGVASAPVVTLGHEHPGGDVRLTPAQARALGRHLVAAAERADTIAGVAR